MDLVIEVFLSILLVVGGIFGLVGSYGLLKLRDTMQRMHAPTKASTIGVGSALIGSMIYAAAFQGRLSWQELLVTLFLLITAPITANFLAKAQMHRMFSPDRLPKTGVKTEWATFDVVEGEVKTDQKVKT